MYPDALSGKAEFDGESLLGWLDELAPSSERLTEMQQAAKAGRSDERAADRIARDMLERAGGMS